MAVPRVIGHRCARRLCETRVSLHRFRGPGPVLGVLGRRRRPLAGAPWGGLVMAGAVHRRYRNEPPFEFRCVPGRCRLLGSGYSAADHDARRRRVATASAWPRGSWRLPRRRPPCEPAHFGGSNNFRARTNAVGVGACGEYGKRWAADHHGQRATPGKPAGEIVQDE